MILVNCLYIHLMEMAIFEARPQQPQHRNIQQSKVSMQTNILIMDKSGLLKFWKNWAHKQTLSWALQVPIYLLYWIFLLRRASKQSYRAS